MMKKILYSLLFLFNIALHATPENIPTDVEKELTHFSKTKWDNFDNLVLDIDSIDDTCLQNIESIRQTMAAHMPRKGLYVEVPLAEAAKATSLKSTGFELWYMDHKTERVQYLFKNGRDIPNIHNAYLGGGVLLLRINPQGQKEILVIHEPEKPFLSIPAGCGDDNEEPKETVIREAKEEIGIELNTKDLKLFAVATGTRKDIKVAWASFFYTYNIHYDVEVKVDNEEVDDAQWVLLSEVENFTMHEKKMHPLYAKVIAGAAKDCLEGYEENGITVYQAFSSLQ